MSINAKIIVTEVLMPWGGGGKAGEVEGGGVKSIALPKLGRCGAGLKITPGQQTMSGRNK